MKVMLLGVSLYLREVELRRVPATDAVVRAKVPLDGVLVGFCLIPLWQQEHVFTILMCKPSYGHFGLQGLIVSGKKFNLELSQDGMGFQLKCLCELKRRCSGLLLNISWRILTWPSIPSLFVHGRHVSSQTPGYDNIILLHQQQQQQQQTQESNTVKMKISWNMSPRSSQWSDSLFPE